MNRAGPVAVARLLLGRGDGMCQALKSTYPLETTMPFFFSSLAHEWPRHQASFQFITTQQQAAFVAELVAHNARRKSFRPRAEKKRAEEDSCWAAQTFCSLCASLCDGLLSSCSSFSSNRTTRVSRHPKELATRSSRPSPTAQHSTAQHSTIQHDDGELLL